MQFYRIKRRNNVYIDDSIRHSHGQPNPLKHARARLDCDCEIIDVPKTLKLDCYFDETDCKSKEYTGEYKALRKIRNSKGSAVKQEFGYKPVGKETVSAPTHTMSNREYLKRKTATYDQKKYNFVIDDENSAKNKYRCMNSQDVECCTTWKPSNNYYQQDGGVSSSANIQRKKYDAIQKTATTMNVFDHGTVSAHAYSGRNAAPFTLKNNYSNGCTMKLFTRMGTKRRCG